MPATMNARVTEGPARSAIAAAVRTKRPAPMMAPIPRATSAIGPSVRFSVPSPLASASARRRSTDLVLNSAFTLPSLLPRLYAAWGTVQVPPGPLARVAAGQQIADDGDGIGAGVEHSHRRIERDAADRHKWNPACAGPRRRLAHAIESDGVVAGRLRLCREH